MDLPSASSSEELGDEGLQGAPDYESSSSTSSSSRAEKTPSPRLSVGSKPVSDDSPAAKKAANSETTPAEPRVHLHYKTAGPVALSVTKNPVDSLLASGGAQCLSFVESLAALFFIYLAYASSDLSAGAKVGISAGVIAFCWTVIPGLVALVYFRNLERIEQAPVGQTSITRRQVLCKMCMSDFWWSNLFFLMFLLIPCGVTMMVRVGPQLEFEQHLFSGAPNDLDPQRVVDLPLYAATFSDVTIDLRFSKTKVGKESCGAFDCSDGSGVSWPVWCAAPIFRENDPTARAGAVWAVCANAVGKPWELNVDVTTPDPNLCAKACKTVRSSPGEFAKAGFSHRPIEGIAVVDPDRLPESWRETNSAGGNKQTWSAFIGTRTWEEGVDPLETVEELIRASEVAFNISSFVDSEGKRVLIEVAAEPIGYFKSGWLVFYIVAGCSLGLSVIILLLAVQARMRQTWKWGT
jgi:hypothetical protein